MGKMSKRLAAVPDEFLTRAIHRMHEVGLVDSGARDRLLDTPMPEDPHVRLGIVTALLGVALWGGHPRLADVRKRITSLTLAPALHPGVWSELCRIDSELAVMLGAMDKEPA